MFNARTQKRIAAMVLRTLSETCAIQAAGARSGQTMTYATKAGQTAVACRFVKPRPQDVAIIADKLQGRMPIGVQF